MPQNKKRFSFFSPVPVPIQTSRAKEKALFYFKVYHTRSGLKIDSLIILEQAYHPVPNAKEHIPQEEADLRFTVACILRNFLLGSLAGLC